MIAMVLYDYYTNPHSKIFMKFRLVSLFNGISTLVGYLMPMPFSEKIRCGTSTPGDGDSGVHTFPKGISVK